MSWPWEVGTLDAPVQIPTPSELLEKRKLAEQGATATKDGIQKSIMFQEAWNKQKQIDFAAADAKLLRDLDTVFVASAPKKIDAKFSPDTPPKPVEQGKGSPVQWPDWAKVTLENGGKAPDAPEVRTAEELLSWKPVDLNSGNKVTTDIPTPKEALTQVEKVFDLLPKTLQNLIKWLFDFLKKVAGNLSSPEVKKDYAQLFNKKETFDNWKPLLSKYWAKIADGKGNYELQFASDARITWKKVGKSETWNSTSTTQAEPIEVKNGKIIVGKDALITWVTEKGEGNITVSIQNKNGSVESYEISGAKKVETLPTQTA
jgi:hypothetical protein